jgi:hypothetical protein
MPAAVIKCLWVWYWKTLHRAPLRQFYLEALKITLVSTLPIEFQRWWLRAKRAIAFWLYLKGLKVSLIARTTIERRVGLTPIFPSVYLLTVKGTHAVHDI